MINITLSNGSVVEVDYTSHYGNVARVAETFKFASEAYYKSIGLNYLDVPEIVGITGACENVDTLFKVSSRVKVPLFFSQTGQLSLEQALQYFHGVCTVIHSGRDEELEDERHLRQFMLTEEEFDSTLLGMTRENYDEEKMYDALLSHIEGVLKAVIKSAVDKHADLLISTYKRDVDALKYAIERPFYKIEYREAVKLLQQNGHPELKFGDDLGSDHEAAVVKLLAGSNHPLPVFIMKYPQEIKFFNMKPYTKDETVVLSADLVLPFSGEAVGSAVREHDYERLKSRLLNSKMYELHTKRGGKLQDFDWYLNIMKEQKTNPHAGYGIGNERVLQYIFGFKDIRHSSVMALLAQQTKDWEVK